MEALDLAVHARSVRLRTQVADLMASEQLPEGPTVHVAYALSVITRLTSMPCSAKKASARERKPVARGALVGVDLGVGKP